MTANHPILLAAVRRARRAYIIATIVVVPFSAFLLAAPAWSSEGRGITIAATAMGAAFMVVGVLLARMAWLNWHAESAPVIKALAERPSDVAWIYEEQINSQAGGILVAKTYNLKIQLIDGKGFHLTVRGREREEALGLLADIAPRATFGYSRELARQYKRDPRSLLATA